jgi:hypothetical protein
MLFAEPGFCAESEDMAWQESTRQISSLDVVLEQFGLTREQLRELA